MQSRLRALLFAGVGIAALAAAAPASAAIQLGRTDVAPVLECGPLTALQSTSPGNSYAAPTGGVITSWLFHAGTPAPSLVSFRVGRRVGGDGFYVVAETNAVPPKAAAVSGYLTRIPVAAGDVIGFSTFGGLCGGLPPDETYEVRSRFGEVAAGASADFGPGFTGILPVAANLEPDGDADGFGDESQDHCTAAAGTFEGCSDPPPATKLLKRPPRTSNERTARFTFAASDRGSTFACRLGNRRLKPCTSPKRYRVDAGKHRFEVVATDADGLTDESPATYVWRVVERRG